MSSPAQRSSEDPHRCGAGGTLIVGLSHSGKTEIRTLLESSPRMFASRRSRYWAQPDQQWEPLADPTRRDALVQWLEEAIDTTAWTSDVRAAVLDCVTGGARSYGALLACLHESEARRRGKDRWCVQVGGVEPLLHRRMFDIPGLKVIHAVRDPRDRLSISRPTPPPGRRGWDLGRWERSVQIGLDCETRFPDRYMILTWEEVVHRPETVASRLEEFLECQLDARSISEAGGEKSSSRGGISGPHTVAAVGPLLERMGYSIDPGSGFSFLDVIELATLTLARRSMRRSVDVAVARRSAVTG